MTVKKETGSSSRNHAQGCSSMGKRSEEQSDKTSLSLWHLPSEWHQLSGAEQPRVMQSQRNKEEEEGRKTQLRKQREEREQRGHE